MTVYVLKTCCSDGGYDIIGIFSTLEKAEKAKAARNHQADYIDGYEMDEYLIDRLDPSTPRYVVATA